MNILRAIDEHIETDLEEIRSRKKAIMAEYAQLTTNESRLMAHRDMNAAVRPGISETISQGVQKNPENWLPLSNETKVGPYGELK